MMRTIRASRGFVLPVVLGIILIAALIAVQSATELGSSTLLATQRQLHQRAFEAAESGLVLVLDQLVSGAEPAAMQTMHQGGTPAESATIESQVYSTITLPEGFSADRIVEMHYEVRSTGHSLRGSKVTVVQGVRQTRPGTTR